MNRAEIFGILKGTEWGDSIYRKLSDKKKGKIDNLESILLTSMNEWFYRDINISHDILIKYGSFITAVATESDMLGISNEVRQRLMTRMNNCFEKYNKINITKTNDPSTLNVNIENKIIKFID